MPSRLLIPIKLKNQTFSAHTLLALFTSTFLFGALSVAPSSRAQTVPAEEETDFNTQAEWFPGYEQAPHLAVGRSDVPILSQQTIEASAAALRIYQNIAAGGGWGQVYTTADNALVLGARGESVIQLRQRLMVTGDLPHLELSDNFDSYVEAAVKRFQIRHGLTPSGEVTMQTLKELNVSVEQRIRQLEINLVRLNVMAAGSLPRRFATLNLPSATLETVENEIVVSHHIAGVGKIDRQSPIMNAKVVAINFAPYWTAPASIVKKDLIPLMQTNPNYLAEHKIRMFDAKGQEISPDSINWHSLQATMYRFRQDPGAEINTMGTVRLNIPNPYGVYMHDTLEKGIFGDDSRFISSGCVRIQNIHAYVIWLLKETPGWDQAQVEATFQSGERLDVPLAEPVPVYWTYFTAWGRPDGLVQFREDIYHRDKNYHSSTSSAAAPKPSTSKTKTNKSLKL